MSDREQIKAEIAHLDRFVTDQRIAMNDSIKEFTDNARRNFETATAVSTKKLYELRMQLSDIKRREAEELATNHPLAGKKVQRKLWTRCYRVGGPSHTMEVQHGVIEVVTAQTIQPQHATGWRRVPIGSVAVRLMGKDGKTPRKVLELLTLREDAAKTTQASNLQKDAEVSAKQYEQWLDRFWVIVD